jgi:hypothetical protein
MLTCPLVQSDGLLWLLMAAVGDHGDTLRVVTASNSLVITVMWAVPFRCVNSHTHQHECGFDA